MSSFVQEILNIIEASTRLRYEDERVQKLQITISFKWPTGDVYVDIVGETLEVIAEDLDNSVSKDRFVNELIDELWKFSLRWIQAEIRVRDLEDESIIFHTRSCFSFRDKVVDLTGLNVLKMFEIIINQYDAQLFFFISPNEQFKHFISRGNYSIAAKNSMDHKLKEAKIEAISFICNSNESNQNDLKKCIEIAIFRLTNHCHHFPMQMVSKSKDKKHSVSTGNITNRKPREAVVDLTFDDSDTEDFQENLIVELDDEIYAEAQTSDFSDSQEDELPNSTCNEFILKWKEDASQCKEWLSNEEYKETLKNNFPSDAYANRNGLKPRKIVEEIEKEKVNEEIQKPSKLSFSSAAIPAAFHLLSRKKKTPITEAKPIPSNEPRNKEKIPKLNRDVQKPIDLKPSVPKPPPRSNICTAEEVQRWQNSERTTRPTRFNPLTERQDQIQRDTLKNYKIPKKSDRAVDNDASAPKGPVPRKSIRNGCNGDIMGQYTARSNIPEPSINPKINESFKARLNVIIENMERFDPPSSIQNFIDNVAVSDKKALVSTHNVHDVEDDDVTIVEDDDDIMEVDENQNHKSRKRCLKSYGFSDQSEPINNNNNDKKFFKLRQNKVLQYKLNDVKNSKEDNTDFYNRDNS